MIKLLIKFTHNPYKMTALVNFFIKLSISLYTLAMFIVLADRFNESGSIADIGLMIFMFWLSLMALKYLKLNWYPTNGDR